LPVNQGPIGIFDSGVGGLSVLREVHAALPGESIDYVADSANAPWGDKSREFVRDRGLKIARFLVDQGVKAIVIGSNTGTAGSAEALRGALTIPVVGIEPGIKPAVAATKTGLLTFQRTRTIRLTSAINTVSQSPIAIFPSRTQAPNMVPMAAAYAPLTKPFTLRFARLRTRMGATSRTKRNEGRKIPTVETREPQKPATK